VRSDKEPCLAAANLLDININKQSAPPGRHEHHAERAIWSLKGKLRCALLPLPYTIPPSLYPYAVQYATESANIVPNKKCEPSTPSEIVTGRKVDTNNRQSFGTVATFKVPSSRYLQNAPHRANLLNSFRKLTG
jgi:hypothetical protein